MRAAVMRGIDDVEIRDDVTANDPGPGEVRVRMRAAGVCHSDLSGVNGTAPIAVPVVLGHEGAGEVLDVGPGVDAVAPGDHVIIAWTAPCGSCRFCLGGQGNLCLTVLFRTTPRFTCGDEQLEGFGGVGTFAEEVTLPQEAVIRIDADVPFEVASLVGCAVMTGVGAAIYTARVEPGSSVLVLGCGGVGISAIQGARIAGGAEIVAVDRVEAKLADARRFGASHAVVPDDLPALMAELTGGDGFDYAFEAIGSAATMRTAFDMTRRGGTTCIVGAGRSEEQLQFNAFELFFAEKDLVGSYYGSGNVRTDFHRLLRLWRTGRLDLEGMVSRRIDLADLHEAFTAMERGEVIRSVITYD